MGASSQAASARLEKKFSMKPDADRDEILRRVRTAVANPTLAADRSRPPLTLQPGARGRVLVRAGKVSLPPWADTPTDRLRPPLPSRKPLRC